MTNNAWGKIVAKAWTDEAFKKKLLENPQAVCEEFGLKLPSGAKVQVHENTANEIHIILPQRPEGEMSEKELEQVAAGLPGRIIASVWGN